MSWLQSVFGGGAVGSAGYNNYSGFPAIYSMTLGLDPFVRLDVLTTYKKILTDTAERTHGLTDEEANALWDSCVASDAQSGLISLLACAMLDKSDLFLTYKMKVLRKATNDEAKQIRDDYATKASSSVGVFISFKNYELTDILKIYSALEYCVLSSLHKGVNISKAVQLKMKELRSSTSLADSSIVIEQAKAIADALRSGQDVLVDGEDMITTTTPDVSPTEKTIAFLDAKRAYYLGFPLAYISGLQTGGLSTTGEGDDKAVERGLKLFFESILQPVIQAIFGKVVKFRSHNFRQIDNALSAMKTFDLVADDLLSHETRLNIICRMFDLDPIEEQSNIDEEQAARDKGEADAKANGGSDVQKTAMNGAQVAALVEVISQVSAGAIPRDSAVNVVVLAFQVDAATAEKLVGTAGNGFTATPKAPAPSPFGAPAAKPAPLPGVANA